MLGDADFPHPPSAEKPKETKSNSKGLIIPEEKYFKLSLRPFCTGSLFH